VLRVAEMLREKEKPLRGPSPLGVENFPRTTAPLTA
jgi:hypothetical protein